MATHPACRPHRRAQRDRAFPSARVLASRAEWEYARAPDDFASLAYVREDLDQAIPCTLIEAGEDGYDVFGDGALSMFHTPGHSPGHMSALVALPDTGAVVITGDASDTEDHWNELALPGFATSNRDAVRSVRRLRRIAEREDALVMFGHDAEQWPSVKQGGDYYA